MSKPLLVLGRDDHGMFITHDEFAEAQYQEPWRYERVNGRLVVMNPSGHDHQASGSPIFAHLGAYMLSHSNVVEFVFPEAWVVIDDETERIADIGVYLKTSSGRIPERVPELVFEIVSEGTADQHRDYDDKRAEYERIGIKEYVIVDRFQSRLTVFRLQQGRYQSQILGPSDSYTTPLLPGLEIPLSNVF